MPTPNEPSLVERLESINETDWGAVYHFRTTIIATIRAQSARIAELERIALETCQFLMTKARRDPAERRVVDQLNNALDTPPRAGGG